MTNEALFKIWNTLDSCETMEQTMVFWSWLDRLKLTNIDFHLPYTSVSVFVLTNIKQDMILNKDKRSLYEGVEDDCKPFMKEEVL